MTNMNTPEVSPAESFMSIPGQPYPSLFPPFTPPSSGTVNPMDMLTPSSCYDDSRVAGSSPTPEAEIPASTPVSASASADAQDVKQEDGEDKPKQKKPAKKRKSWGQVLPEPKTNLPPRKRAKTEDEKEQRRVERVLRNRRAAQSSRERKRQEVENLEKVNTELMAKVVAYEKNQAVLLEEIRRLQQEAGANASFSRIQSVLQETSLSFSQKLFDSKCEQPKHEPAAQSAAPSAGQSAAAPLGDILATHKPFTVNPSTISPQLTPIPEEAEPLYSADQPDLSQLAKAQDATLPEQPPTTSTDLTHPAVMPSQDLLCQASAEVPRAFPFPASQTWIPQAWVWLLQLHMMRLTVSEGLTANSPRPPTKLSSLTTCPSMKAPSPTLLTLIIWLVTSPAPSAQTPLASPTSPSSIHTSTRTLRSSTTRQLAPTSLRPTPSTWDSPTLRTELLNKILSSSPNLARPLKDATRVALRLVSEGTHSTDGEFTGDDCETRADHALLVRGLSAVGLPSWHVLMALLWTIHLAEEQGRKDHDENRPSLSTSITISHPESGVGQEPASGLRQDTDTKTIGLSCMGSTERSLFEVNHSRN